MTARPGGRRREGGEEVGRRNSSDISCKQSASCECHRCMGQEGAYVRVPTFLSQTMLYMRLRAFEGGCVKRTASPISLTRAPTTDAPSFQPCFATTWPIYLYLPPSLCNLLRFKRAPTNERPESVYASEKSMR